MSEVVDTRQEGGALVVGPSRQRLLIYLSLSLLFVIGGIVLFFLPPLRETMWRQVAHWVIGPISTRFGLVGLWAGWRSWTRTRVEVTSASVIYRLQNIMIPLTDVLGMNVFHKYGGSHSRFLTLKVRNPSSYHHLDRLDKKYGFIADDEVVLNLALLSKKDFERVVECLTQALRARDPQIPIEHHR